MKDKKFAITMNEYIKHVIVNEPETVEELVDLVRLKYSNSEREEILERILELLSEGKIALREKRKPPSSKVGSYVFSRDAWWYWSIIVLAATTTFLVFTVPENAIPIVYARYLLGSIFVLALPGYSFIKALFPTKELDNIERAALSMGMSLALVPIAGLLLNYTPWGIRITPITFSLLALTITFATAGVIREQQAKLREETQTRNQIVN